MPKRGAVTALSGLRPKSRTFITIWSEVWSCMSPPATLTASTGLPSLSTIVGVSVIRGRLPGSIALAWPAQLLLL